MAPVSSIEDFYFVSEVFRACEQRLFQLSLCFEPRSQRRSTTWEMSSTETSSPRTVGLHGVVQHDHAEGTRRRDDVGARLERLVRAIHVDALADVLFHPHARAARPAAEPFLSTATHLDLGDAGDRVEHAAGFVEDPVVSAQITGVVIGDGPVIGDARYESTLATK